MNRAPHEQDMGDFILATTEERLRKLVDDNLEIEGRASGSPLDLNSSLRNSGASSVDLVAFAKLVVDEFNVPLTAEDCANYGTLGELVAFLDSQAA